MVDGEGEEMKMKLPNIWWFLSLGILAVSLGYFLLNYPAMAVDGTGKLWYSGHKIEAELLASGFPLAGLFGVYAILYDIKKTLEE